MIVIYIFLGKKSDFLQFYLQKYFNFFLFKKKCFFFLQISLLRKYFFITLSTKIFQLNKPDFYIFIYKISKFNPILLIKKLLIGK